MTADTNHTVTLKQQY